jgi:hypothetical protein
MIHYTEEEMKERKRVVKPLKNYKLEIPENNKKKCIEIMEYILSCHYKDSVLTAGACAYILNISKFDFQHKILPKYGIDFTGESL